MKRTKIFAIGLAAAAALSLPALAHGDKDRGQRGGGYGHHQGGGAFGHGMMGGPMMGGGEPGYGMMGGIGQMHGRMLEAFDADGDGSLSAEELRSGLQDKLAEYDADGDGNLSLDEFETLHSDMIREMMVDRFQALDNDGDGQITADEMTAPADRIERMRQMHQRMQGYGDGRRGDMGPGSGRMMDDN